MTVLPDPWPWLLGHALQAPSPHNVQPWRLKLLGEREAELWIEQRRTLPNEDVTGSFIILTMGLFLETLRIVAAHRGFSVDEERVRELDAYSAERLRAIRDPFVPFARLRLREDSSAEPTHALELLDRRRTSRLAYGPEAVDAGTAERLDAIARWWKHRYAQVTEVSRIERLLDWNVEAVFEDLNHAPYHDEIAGWIRYSNTSSQRHRDGLDARCMNVAPAELWLTFHAPALLKLGFARPWFRRRYRDQIGPVATMGFLSGPFWDPRDAYRAGALLMHFWLECTRLGWYLHPYGNLVTNRPTAAKVEAEMGLPDIWLAFKIGRSPEPPKSRRRSIEEVLLA